MSKNNKEFYRLDDLHEACEAENRFFSGLFSTPLLIGGGLMWLILATIFMLFRTNITHYIAWIFIWLALAFVGVWFIFHVVPVLFRWLVNLVS